MMCDKNFARKWQACSCAVGYHNDFGNRLRNNNNYLFRFKDDSFKANGMAVEFFSIKLSICTRHTFYGERVLALLRLLHFVESVLSFFFLTFMHVIRICHKNWKNYLSVCMSGSQREGIRLISYDVGIEILAKRCLPFLNAEIL